MLLAIDVGNTHIVLGLYREDNLIIDWRLMTDQDRTGDEYGIIFQNLFASHGILFNAISGIIVSCVVPPMESTLETVCRRYFHIEPIFVSTEMDLGMRICYDNPREVGADRIVNAVAAFEKHRRSVIVIDFGTATTFDYISPDGAYMGGAIAPGITISGEALFRKASKLPRVDYVSPGAVVAKNTVASMQAGIVYGYVSLVDGIVERIRAEVSTDPYVTATGGLAPLIASHATSIDDVDEYLTLRGLKIIFDGLKKTKAAGKVRAR